MRRKVDEEMQQINAAKKETGPKQGGKEEFCKVITDYLEKTVDCMDVKDIARKVQESVSGFLNTALVAIFIKGGSRMKQIIPAEGLPKGFFFRETMEYTAFSAVRTGKPVCRSIADCKDELLRQELTAIGGMTELSMPINCGGEILGAFTVFLREEGTPAKEVYKFCAAICGFFSVQLKNAMLHEELVRQLNEKLRVETDLDVIFRGSVDMICVVSKGGYMKRINPAFEERLGYSRKELFSRRVSSFAHPEDEMYVDFVLNNIQSEGIMTGFCHRFLTKQGKTIFLELDVRYMADTQEIIAIARDTTDQREAEEKNVVLERSIAVERMKTEFFSNISHEFKTPINIILSSVDLLKLKLQRNDEKLYTEQYKRFFTYTEQNSYKLLRLINNLLDCTKIENGALTLLGHNCAIVPFIREVVKTTESYAQTHQIAIEFETRIPEDTMLYCDQDKLDRILLNLLSNSIKHTPAGGTIRVVLDQTKEHILMSVSDTGDGIAENALPHIFEKFKIHNNGFVKTCDGSGVGLSIVKGLAELHGGTAVATSARGKGSTFTVSLSKNLWEVGTASNLAAVGAHQDMQLHQSRLQMEMADLE